MSDDDVDLELLELLRRSLGITKQDPNHVPRETGVLKDAEFIYNNSIDVFIDMYGTKAAASAIYTSMHARGYSATTWNDHELHPKTSEGFSEIDVVNFIFTMDLLNFSFWSELSETERYQVEYRGKRWTGYDSLVACLRRAIDENIPVTTPASWEERYLSDETLRHVFRSATQEEIPLLSQRIAILRETARILLEQSSATEDADFDEADDEAAPPAGLDLVGVSTNAIATASKSTSAGHTPEIQEVLHGEGFEGRQRTERRAEDGAISTGHVPNPAIPEPRQDELVPTDQISTNQASHHPPIPRRDLSVIHLIKEADKSAGKLVNLLAKHFPAFRDETRFDGRRVKLLKRAQIFVADLWAATNGTGYGEFHDIGHLTMFADYRVPQILTSLGILSYSPPLFYTIKDGKLIPSGHSWEVQLRGCSIWAVELIRREILKNHPEANVNAVLIDFFLYDLAKEKEKAAKEKGQEVDKCHRVRSIWY